MGINYDPGEHAKLSLEAMRQAHEMGLHPVNVMCDPEGASVGEPTGVSFIAMVSEIPRVGDEIKLEDGSFCRVKRVTFSVTSPKAGMAQKFITMSPNVYAVQVPEPGAS